MKTKIVMNQDKNRVELDIIVVKWELGRGEIGGIDGIFEYKYKMKYQLKFVKRFKSK